MVRLHNDDVTHLRLVTDHMDGHESADEMKNFVMGMIAVAIVLCVVIGSVLLSDVLRIIATMVCDTLDLPTLVRFH